MKMNMSSIRIVIPNSMNQIVLLQNEEGIHYLIIFSQMHAIYGADIVPGANCQCILGFV